jgi:4-methylaminobutanoate oxidase (formaldehyde-forming)
MPDFFEEKKQMQKDGVSLGAAGKGAAGDGVEERWWAGEDGWGRPSFWQQWAQEHHTCRQEVGLIDMSFMSKFWVEGPRAGELLDLVSTAKVDGATDRVVYTQWLDKHGKLLGDVTVTKLSPTSFLVIVTDSMHRHAEAHLRGHLREREEAGGTNGGCVIDVTDAYALISVQGPKSRELLQKLTDTDLSNEAFPFGASRELEIGFVKARCSRITYVGELGYELLVATSHAVHVFDTLLGARTSTQPVRPVGLKVHILKKNVLSTGTFCGKCTRPLTFENFCHKSAGPRQSSHGEGVS